MDERGIDDRCLQAIGVRKVRARDAQRIEQMSLRGDEAMNGLPLRIVNA